MYKHTHLCKIYKFLISSERISNKRKTIISNYTNAKLACERDQQQKLMDTYWIASVFTVKRYKFLVFLEISCLQGNEGNPTLHVLCR